jgi:SPP1 gp7 family putative phage head morphogenesis protein
VIHFAVAPHRAAGVNRAESRLQRDLLLVQAFVLSSAEQAVKQRNRSWSKPRLPKPLARRVQESILTVLRLGASDAREEMKAASTKIFAAEPVPMPEAEPVLAQDISAYRRLATVLAEQMIADHYDLLKEVVIEGLRGGLTDREIGAELRAADLLQSAAHARTWARTETTRYYTAGRSAEIEAAGNAVWGYEYVVIEDNRTTDICHALIGKRVAKADMSHYPPFHYNCRTTVMAVMAQWVTDEEPAPDGTLLTTPPRPAEGFGQALPLAA